MTIPLFICIAGLVLWVSGYGPHSRPWILSFLSDTGKIAFAAGLLVTLLSVTGKTIW